jgi:hypothetical protein
MAWAPKDVTARGTIRRGAGLHVLARVGLVSQITQAASVVWSPAKTRLLPPSAHTGAMPLRLALKPMFKQLRDEGAPERTLHMRRALRSPRYGVELGGTTCLVILTCFAFSVICPLIPLFGAVICWRVALLAVGRGAGPGGGPGPHCAV